MKYDKDSVTDRNKLYSKALFLYNKHKKENIGICYIFSLIQGESVDLNDYPEIVKHKPFVFYDFDGIPTREEFQNFWYPKEKIRFRITLLKDAIKDSYETRKPIIKKKVGRPRKEFIKPVPISRLKDIDDKITLKRRDGNTTRIIDNAIQVLFSKNSCIVADHYENGGDWETNEYLLKKILKRLSFEHYHIMKHVQVDKTRYPITITILKKPIKS